MEAIDELISAAQAFYDDARANENGRSHSWEHCYRVFRDARTDPSPDYDYLSLHLAFYLASWGMYRGSCFIFHKDYKVHTPIVEKVLKPEYDCLFGLACTDVRNRAVSMGGSNEFVECFCWGAVAEGGSGAVVQFVGDGVEVGLVAGDGGSFGQVAADEPVGVFVGSSLPGAVGVSEEHVHAGVVGEALVAGHFPALIPGQCSHRLVGQALDAAGERAGPGRLSDPGAGRR